MRNAEWEMGKATGRVIYYSISIKKNNNNTNENSHVYLACLYIKEIVERHEQVVIIDSFRNIKAAVERGFS